MPDWLESLWLPLVVTLLGGVIVIVIGLVLEYRTRWFARRRASARGKETQYTVMSSQFHVDRQYELDLFCRRLVLSVGEMADAHQSPLLFCTPPMAESPPSSPDLDDDLIPKS